MTVADPLAVRPDHRRALQCQHGYRAPSAAGLPVQAAGKTRTKKSRARQAAALSKPEQNLTEDRFSESPSGKRKHEVDGDIRLFQ